MPFQIPDNIESWSDEELARAIMIRAGACYGSSRLRNPKLSEEEASKIFVQVFDPAARDYGFACHADLPIGVRLKIGHVGGRGRAAMTREIDTAGPAVCWEPEIKESLFPITAPTQGKLLLNPEQEEELARELIELSVQYISRPWQKRSFLYVFGLLAKEKGYRSYNALPKGTKRFISHSGGVASRNKRWEKERNARQIQMFEETPTPE